MGKEDKENQVVIRKESPMRPKILLLGEPCDKAKEILQEAVDIVRNGEPDFDMVWTGLTPQSLYGVPVACPCTGVDHIQSPHIIYLDEKWKASEGRKVTSTAEHTWSLILQLAKKKRMQLYGKKICIIGHGRIGKLVCEYALAFGMKVNLIVNELMWEDKEIVNKMLSESDIITIHVPLNDSTYLMIGSKEMAIMKRGVLLVNTSREPIIDQDALDEYLFTAQHIGGYADDFGDFNKVTGLGTHIIRTPHIAGNCIEAREATDIYIAKEVVKYVKDNYNC